MYVRSNPQHSDILTLSGPISSFRIFRHICPVQSPTFGYSNTVRSNFQPSDIPTYMSGTLGTFLVRLPCYVTSRAPSSCSRIPRQPAPQPAAHDTHHNPHTPASSTWHTPQPAYINLFIFPRLLVFGSYLLLMTSPQKQKTVAMCCACCLKIRATLYSTSSHYAVMTSLARL